MTLALNILWFILGGFVAGLVWLLITVVAFVSIVFAPLGPACLRLAIFTAAPFGRDIVDKRVLDGTESNPATATIRAGLNILWLVLIGWWLALAHIVVGVAYCVTLIGIPFGVQHFKLAGAAWWPVGREVVTTEEARIARTSSAKNAIEARRQRV